MRSLGMIALAITALHGASFSYAQTVARNKPDITRAQVEMHQRINADVNRFAREIDFLDRDWDTYCRVEMDLKKHTQPQDGNVPFGVNYGNINSEEELRSIISVREAYEKSFLKLCLAKAKKLTSEARGSR
jgi:hypothetical protein